jgi:hypothetical protein
MDLAIQAINAAADSKIVVANYVVRREDYKRFEHEIHIHPQVFITLSPSLKVAQSKRGNRILTEWEVKRIKAHYDGGIASPDYGYIIDNSNLAVEETVNRIIEIVMTHTQ